MNIRSLFAVMLVVGLLGWAPTGATAVLDTSAASATLAYADGALLIENVGQFPDYILFQAFGSSGRMLVGRDSLWVAASPPAASADQRLDADPRHVAVQPTTWVQVRFKGARAVDAVTPSAPLATAVSYFYGQDATAWHSQVPTWGAVRLHELYPGIDLVLEATDGRIQPRLAARSGADLSQVALQLPAGVTGTLVDGALEVASGTATARLPLLTAEQPLSGMQPRIVGRTVQAPFAVAPLAFGADSNFVFYQTISGSASESINNVEVDASNRTYFVGQTASLNMPVTSPISGTYAGGGTDALLGRLAATGQFLSLSFWGGKGFDVGYGLHLDATTGDVLVVGYTNSSDYPATVGDTSVAPGGNCSFPGGITADCYDLFVSRFSSNLQTMIAGTLEGSGQHEYGYGITSDAIYVYVAGVTYSPNFSVPQDGSAADATMGGPNEGIVLRFSSALTNRTAATFIGGAGEDDAFGIDVDLTGRVYVSGYTTSSALPGAAGSNGFDMSLGGTGDGYMIRLSPNLDTVIYRTYLGGNGSEFPNRLFVDRSVVNPNANIVGSTRSNDFPTTANAYSNVLNGPMDGFLIGISPVVTVTNPVYSTYIGGSGEDAIYAVEVRQASGIYYLAGETSSTDLPTTVDAQLKHNSFGQTGFVFIFDPGATNKIRYSSYLGKNTSTRILDLGVDSAGRVTGAGSLSSGADAFLFRLRLRSDKHFLWVPLLKQ